MTASTTIHRNIGHGPRAPCFPPGLIAAGLAAAGLAASLITLSLSAAQGGACEADQAKRQPILALNTFTHREVSVT